MWGELPSSLPAYTALTPSHSHWSSRSPNLQVAPPISGKRSAPDSGDPHDRPHPGLPAWRGHGGGKEEEGNQEQRDAGKMEKGEQKVEQGAGKVANQDINPRYIRAAKEHLASRPHRNPIFFQQKQLDIPEGNELEEEEEEEEEGGKWKGRNINEDENNRALEEQDDMEANVGDDGQEDVGGEALKKKTKKKRQRHLEKRINEVNGNQGKREEKQALEHFNHKASKGHASWGRNPYLQMADRGERDPADDNLDGVEEVMAGRRARVKEVCRNYGLSPRSPKGPSGTFRHPPTPNYEAFYIDRSDSLAWCPIYKAASTSWLYSFLNLAGLSESYVKNTKEQVSHVARRVWPSLSYLEAQQALNACTKFMIVRHPFERLVSAFRDKLEDTTIDGGRETNFFYRKYGKMIVEKYRQKENHPPPSPPGRYAHILDDPAEPHPLGIEPTFAEFVKYLIDIDLAHYADDHWMPYYLFCTPCLVDYQVIAKFETLERDSDYLLRKTRLEKKIKPSWRNPAKGHKTSVVVQKYFGTITKADLLNLYKKYRLDFELFDYTIDEYLGYVLPS